MEINEKTTKEELIAILNNPETDDATYEMATKEHRARILTEKQNQQKLQESLKTTVKAVRSLGISFENFITSEDHEGQTAFSLDEVKAYAAKQNWIKTVIKEQEAAAKPRKEAVIVGTFKLADYGFSMPKKAGTDDPISNATELKWDFNQKFAGTSWELKFIRAITEKGLDDIEQHLTGEFKKWLETSETPAKGIKANTAIFYNKRKFYKKFGLDENKNPL